MKTIYDITQDHMASRFEASQRPMDWVQHRAAEIVKEAEQAKVDPSVLALAAHFAVECENQVRVIGWKVDDVASAQIKGCVSAAVAQAIREWDAINREYQEQFIRKQS